MSMYEEFFFQEIRFNLSKLEAKTIKRCKRVEIDEKKSGSIIGNSVNKSDQALVH